MVAYFGWEESNMSGQFQELLEALLSCLPSCLQSFPAGWNVSFSEESVNTTCNYFLVAVIIALTKNLGRKGFSPNTVLIIEESQVGA